MALSYSVKYGVNIHESVTTSTYDYSLQREKQNQNNFNKFAWLKSNFYLTCMVSILQKVDCEC